MAEAPEKPELDPEDHYFWVDRRLAYLPAEALSKKALLLYLLYARSCNPKWLNCSMASYTVARETLGLHRYTVDQAREELVKKGFVRLRSDVKPGFFKTTPVEVLSFPSLGNHSAINEGTRSLKKTTEAPIFLPSWLLDRNWLHGMSLLELRTLLYLYDNCRLEERLGVDFQVIHAWSRDNPRGVRKTGKQFGEGFHPSILGKECFEVVEGKQWWSSEKAVSLLGEGIYKALNSLKERGLLYIVPVVVWHDPEDEDIAELKRQIYQGCVRFQGEDGKGKGKCRLAPVDTHGQSPWHFKIFKLCLTPFRRVLIHPRAKPVELCPSGYESA